MGNDRGSRSQLSDGLVLVTRHPTPAVSVHSWSEQSQRPRRFGTAMHQDLELGWVERGVVHYRVGRRDIELTPGALILLPAGHEHETRIASSARAHSIHLSAELVDGVAEVLDPKLQLVPGLVQAPQRLLAVASLLLDECEQGGAGTSLVAEGLGEALAVNALRGATAGDSRRPTCRDVRIMRALQAIETAAGADLDVEGLARVAGMSRYHFSRMFRDLVGESPYQHLLNVRLTRAAELLRGGSSVTEAALGAGFTDFGRFAAHFQRRFGRLPSQMQRARSARRIARIA